jgi:predicted  nucleic acid-binding Zn-ribbon protein
MDEATGARERREIREDIRDLHDEVTMLRESKAAQQVTLEHIEETVQRLTEAVTELTSTLDKSRGALYVISGVSGAVGAVVAWLAGGLFHKT